MRLLKQRIGPDGEGLVRLAVEEAEDLYAVYNLVAKGDFVRSSTMRKVVSGSSSGTAVQTARVRLVMTVEVEAAEYDPADATLRVKGRNAEENEHVKLGAYHTLELAPGRAFTLRKARWDSVYLDRLREATDVAARAQVAAVVMQMGLALVCLVTDQMTLVRAKVELSVAKKRAADTAAHEKDAERFFQSTLDALARNVDFDVVKCVVVASPGFVKDQFVAFMDEQLASSAAPQAPQHQPLAGLRANRAKLVLARSSSGHKQALVEVLAKPEIQAKMSDTKAAEEVRALRRFLELLNTGDGDQACYGFAHVRAALDANAVADLLVCDDLFRGAATLAARRRYVELVDRARASGCRVFVFSKLHASGEQLSSLSGVAASLRFPMPHLGEEEDLDVDRVDVDRVDGVAEGLAGVSLGSAAAGAGGVPPAPGNEAAAAVVAEFAEFGGD